MFIREDLTDEEAELTVKDITKGELKAVIELLRKDVAEIANLPYKIVIRYQSLGLIDEPENERPTESYILITDDRLKTVGANLSD